MGFGMGVMRSEDIFGTRISIMDDDLEGEGSERAPYVGSIRVTVALSVVPYAHDPRTAFGSFCFLQSQLFNLPHFNCRNINR